MSRYFKGVDLTEAEDDLIYSTWAEAGERIRERERKGLIKPDSIDWDATTLSAQVGIGMFVMLKMMLAEQKSMKRPDNCHIHISGSE